MRTTTGSGIGGPPGGGGLRPRGRGRGRRGAPRDALGPKWPPHRGKWGGPLRGPAWFGEPFAGGAQGGADPPPQGVPPTVKWQAPCLEPRPLGRVLAEPVQTLGLVADGFHQLLLAPLIQTRA